MGIFCKTNIYNFSQKCERAPFFGESSAFNCKNPDGIFTAILHYKIPANKKTSESLEAFGGSPHFVTSAPSEEAISSSICLTLLEYEA